MTKSVDRIDNLEKMVMEIKDNHLSHLKDDISETKEMLIENKTNVDWLMKFFWIVISSSVGALIVGILNFVGK